MATKLISANFGLVLELEIDGKQKKVQFSAICPSESEKSIQKAVLHMREWIKSQLEIQNWDADVVKIAKPKKIKATKRVSQNEYNKKVKELGYENQTKENRLVQNL